MKAASVGLAVSATLALGGCWLIYAVLLHQFDPNYYHPSSPVDYLAVALYSTGLVLLAPAITAIHGRQAAHAGLDERIGVWALGIGAVVAGVGNLGEDGFGFPLMGSWLYFPGVLSVLVGFVLFGVGTMRARVLPMWCGGVLLLNLMVGLFVGGLFSNWWGTLLFGLIWIVFGFALWFHQRHVVSPGGSAS